MEPITPISILFLGSLFIFLGRSQSFRVNGVISLVSVMLSVVATLLLGFHDSMSVVLSDWRSLVSFGDSLRLTVDRLSWAIALTLLISFLAASLAGLLARSERSRGYRASSLLLIACAMVSIFADNLMTVAAAWVALDLATFFSLSYVRKENYAVADLSLSLLAVALVIAAAVVVADAGASSTVLSSANLSTHGILFLVVAVIFRVGMYSVNGRIGRGDDKDMVVLQAATRLARLAVAVDLLVILVMEKPLFPMRNWLTGAVILAGLISGIKWYWADRPRVQLQYMFVAQFCVMMMIFLWGGQWASAGVLAQGISVILSSTILIVYRGKLNFRHTWALSSGLAVLMLGGMPLTIGFIGMLTLYSGLLESGILIFAIPLIVIIQALLTAGGFGLVSFPRASASVQAPFVNVGYRLSLTIPVVVGFLGGVLPGRVGVLSGVDDMPNWGAMLTRGGSVAVGCSLLGISIGVGLWFFKENLYSRYQSNLRRAFFFLVELQWIRAVTLNVYGGTTRVMRAIALVLEGQGGVLWALVVISVVLLVLGA